MTVPSWRLFSSSTKARLERYVRAHGVKKGVVLESALLHHLEALEELPPDVAAADAARRGARRRDLLARCPGVGIQGQ